MKTLLTHLEPYVLSLYEHLHAHPEISWKEVNTTAFIEKRLNEEGYVCKRFSTFPGLIAETGKGKPVVAVRADMDALWQEQEGKHEAIHSCGHDAHMAIVMGTAILFKQLQPSSKGTVRFIFQPAEETGEGAKAVTELGVVDDIDYLYGLHLRPSEELPLGEAAPAINHGASEHILGKISGEDAHGARPHLGTSAFETGQLMNQLLHQIKLSPVIPHSIKITRFEMGGEQLNIIPGTALFGLDIRAQTNHHLDLLKKKIHHVFEQLIELLAIKIDVISQKNTPASIVSMEAKQYMEESILDTLGKQGLKPTVITPGSDDFHFYTKLRPGIHATMLALGANLKPGLHHPHMTIDRSCLIHGTEIMTRVIIYTLQAHST